MRLDWYLKEGEGPTYREGYYSSPEKYVVKQNPSDKLWYVLGNVGKYFMPVSSGYKSKAQADAYAKKQPKADAAAKNLATV